jgi:hypothetical protein
MKVSLFKPVKYEEALKSNIMLNGLVKKRGSLRPMIDEKAFQSLRNNSQYFINLLGEPQKGENGFIFSIKDLPFKSFTIRYDIDKKFLGKIYVMVLEVKVSGGENSSVHGRIELRYSGFIKKGKPFFASVPARKENCDEMECSTSESEINDCRGMQKIGDRVLEGIF